MLVLSPTCSGTPILGRLAVRLTPFLFQLPDHPPQTGFERRPVLAEPLRQSRPCFIGAAENLQTLPASGALVEVHRQIGLFVGIQRTTEQG